MLKLSNDLVSLILTLLIPVATGLVTKSTASTRVKALVAIVLAAAVTLFRESRTDSGAAIISTQMAVAWALTLAVQLAAYLGIYKPITPRATEIAPARGLG